MSHRDDLLLAEGPLTAPGLSRRLRQTLTCLLAGDSEKRAATRLGISRSTQHQYVTMLYRYFGVSSRSQLLALFLRRAERSAKTS